MLLRQRLVLSWLRKKRARSTLFRLTLGFSTPENRNFSIWQCELLSLLEAYERYDIYISNHPTYSYCDNQAVVYLVKQENPCARIQRWIARLIKFAHIKLRYLKGSANTIADFLTRCEQKSWIDYQPDFQTALERLSHLIDEQPFDRLAEMSDPGIKPGEIRKKKDKSPVVAPERAPTEKRIENFFNQHAKEHKAANCATIPAFSEDGNSVFPTCP